jgi:large subunit ribosomal protein L12e
VSVLPCAAPLLIKALGEPPRDRKKVKNVVHNGNLKFDEIINISKQIKEKGKSKTFAGIVKQVLGTAMSIGCTVDKKSPKEIQVLIDDGEYECKA